MADRCECGLPLDPPRDQDYYWPSIDSPDPRLRIVVRYGEHPTYRRAVRVPSGWMKRGVSVDGSGPPSAIVAWQQVGMCWANEEHPVVEVAIPGGPVAAVDQLPMSADTADLVEFVEQVVRRVEAEAAEAAKQAREQAVEDER